MHDCLHEGSEIVKATEAESGMLAADDYRRGKVGKHLSVSTKFHLRKMNEFWRPNVQCSD